MADKFQIERLLKNYDLGQIISINDQSHGYANRNFSVECSGGFAFVRFCDQQLVKNIEQEILLMTVLKEHNFKTAYPVCRNDGEYLSFVNSVPVLVYDLLEGDLPELNENVVSEIATAIADLSTIRYPSGLNKKNAISFADSKEIIDTKAFSTSPYTDVTGNFVNIFKQLEEKLQDELPVGIVHGDVFPDNTLFSDDRLVGLVDFEEFAIDYLLFDVGMTINGFCFNGVNMNRDLFARFIKEYNSVRQLTSKELIHLIDYVCWGAVGMTSWHLHQLLYRKNKEQLKRVRTLLERARLINIERGSLESLLSSVI